MQFKSEVIVHGVKASQGTVDGRAFNSTTFHCEVDLQENSSGGAIGRATRPFKCGDAAEFKKWEHLGNSLPIKAVATFEMAAASQDGTKMVMVDIKPVAQANPATKAQ